MSRRLRGIAREARPLLELTAAATAAWLIALQFGGHGDPFFAPIAVVVALSSPLGERGSNAVRLLLGVLIGISVGEITILMLGGGYGRLALSMFLAMVFARLLGSPRLVIVQAAAGAILTVAAANGEAGVNRLIDAAIGAAVALFFSQVLLSPEPVALVRGAVADALGRMAGALRLTAQALEQRDDDLADEALNVLRDVRDSLAELARLRKASGRVARHSAIWRSRIEPTVRENENAGHLDLLGASCLLLTRTVAQVDLGACRTLAPSVDRLAEAVERIAADPGDKNVRQASADDALEVARNITDVDRPDDVSFTTAVLAVRMVTIDVMVVAGVDLDVAVAAVREGTAELDVPSPPRTFRLPFVPRRLRRRRS